MTTAASDRVHRDEIESKLRELRGDIEATASAARVPLAAVAAVAVVGLVGFAYLAGRRRGRKRSTVVEIRRV